MLLEGAHGAYLHCVHVRGAVLEQTVVGIEELAGEQVEELTGRSTIVETLFAVEADEDLVLSQIVLAQLHELDSSVVHELLAPDDDLGFLRSLAVAFRFEFSIKVAQLVVEPTMVLATVFAATALQNRWRCSCGAAR